MVARICDWPLIDWCKTNAQIAAETGAAITTIIKRRTQYGHAAGYVYRQRPDNAARNSTPEARARTAQRQPAATEAARISPRAGRGPENVHALDWHLISPAGAEYRTRNLYEFVRTNPELFAPADVAWKRQGGGRGTGGEWCNATAGLLNVKAGRSRAWKGWVAK